MVAAIPLQGLRFGRLVVLSRTEERKRRCALWLCVCDCGRQVKLSSWQLRSGNNKSCGCQWHLLKHDLEGRVFGRLRVISFSGSKPGGRTFWRCQCECGEVVDVRTDNLLSKTAISCGCYQKEQSAKAMRRVATTHGMSNTREYQRDLATRRNRKVSAGQIDHAELRSQIEELGGRCVYCGGDYEEIDHFIPLAKGGKHEVRNLLPSCRKCNRSKRAKMPGVEWWPSKWGGMETMRPAMEWK